MSVDSFSDIVSPTSCGVRLTVRAKPGLSRARDIKVVDIGDGKRAIEVSVAADAREGKANRALVERLAEELGVPKKQISIKSGKTGRLKIVEISGGSETLLKCLSDLINSSRAACI